MLLELRVARAWQVPPTRLRDWSQEDRNLAAALLAHEADLGRCGYPHRVTTNPDLDGWIGLPEGDEAADDVVCVVCAELDRYAKDNPTPEPGQVLRIVDRRHQMTTDRRE